MKIECGDYLELLKDVPDGSVDMILTDLPYNLTNCAWDKSTIDLAAMWTQFKRILKPYCSAVLFASGKFTHKLIASNFEWFKYKWIWVKNTPTMFVHAKNAPMRRYEEIVVFSDGVINHETVSTRRMKYNPQGLVDCELLKSEAGKDKPTRLREGGRGARWTNPNDVIYFDKNDWRKNYNWARKGRLNAESSVCFAKRNSHVDYYVQEQTGYPSDVLNFNALPTAGRLHPTQKPVDLLEYLIKTYSNEGETVLDATMGSGSTGVACINTGRRFIGFEKEKKFFEIAQKRIAEAIAKKEQSLF